MSEKNSITDLTRRDIADYLSMEKVVWAGRLDEDQFVVRVWPDAADLPSYDRRFTGALADIHQHRVFNPDDWQDDWIFHDSRFNLMGGDDDQFLAFLAEVVHPVVRSDVDEVAKLIAEFNRQLRPDGYVLAPASHISGKPIYAGSRITASHSPASALSLPTRTLLEDHTALLDHLDAIGRDMTTDPAGAITSAKTWSRRCTSSSWTSEASLTAPKKTSRVCTKRSPASSAWTRRRYPAARRAARPRTRPSAA
ncbi:MAG: hypothetical protein ACRD0W_07885 [Acidimicrobiales bacterium]